MIKKYKEIIDTYYESFKNKKPDLLKNIFSDDITLRDWEIEASGIGDVLKISKEIMNTDGFSFKIINELYDDNFAVVEMEIDIAEERIKVIDLFKIENSKIKSIKAFKG